VSFCIVRPVVFILPIVLSTFLSKSSNISFWKSTKRKKKQRVSEAQEKKKINERVMKAGDVHTELVTDGLANLLDPRDGIRKRIQDLILLS
jgi:Flp pilus assembly protein TadB